MTTVFVAATPVQPSQIQSPLIDQVHEPAEHQQCVALIEGTLAEDALQRARQRGAAMTLDEALDYALNLLDDA